MQEIPWDKICGLIAKKVNSHKGTSFFIRKAASFENWFQVELVRILIHYKFTNIEIEKVRNNNTDILCNNKKIEIKISSKKSRKISGEENSIKKDLEKAHFVLVIALDLKNSDFIKYHLTAKKDYNVFRFRNDKKEFPVISQNCFELKTNSDSLQCRVLIIKGNL